jgi:NAD(P)-dependent dehydrogenase (short-subunit alcohol dehydrogenase family)
MRILVVGATGTVGKEVVQQLEPDHDVVRVGRSSGDMQVDYTDPGAVQAMFEQAGRFDGLVATVGGDSVFKSYEELDDEDFRQGFERKFLGQLRLVRMGVPHASPGASFTLSSGFLSDYPNPWSIATGPLNAGLNVAVSSIAPVLPDGVRLNVVSAAPIVSPDQAGLGKVTAQQVAAAYLESINGDFSGRVLRAWGGLSVPSDAP